MYCGVILRGAVRQTDRLYTYHVPEELEGSVLPGSMVSVPFGMGDTQKTAVVIELKDSFDGDLAKIKDIGSLMSSLPVLNGDQIAMIGNISERFNCTRGEVVELMVPSCVVNHKDPMEVFVELIQSRQQMTFSTVRSSDQPRI